MNQALIEDAQGLQETDLHKYISFTLDRGEFCVDIMTVREIGGWSEPTPLPHAPHYVCGVINLRGTVLPIIDFAARIGVTNTGEDNPRPVTIIMQVDSRLFGIKVDSVSDILVLDQTKMQTLPDNAMDESHAFLDSIMALEDRMIRVVDPSSLCPASAVGVK